MALSNAAKAVCGQYFPTADCVIRSSPPHKTLSDMRQAMDELVVAGLVTERPYNAHGMIEIKGSAAASEVSREHRKAVFSKALA